MRFDPNHPTGVDGVIAVDKVGNRVLFLDPGMLRTRGEIGGFAPNVHELAISPQRDTAYAPIYGDGRHGANPHPGDRIAVIDIASRSHTGYLSVAPHLAPHGLRWGPRGELYCVCEDSAVVLALDPRTGEHRATLNVGSTNAHRIEVLPDGSKLYTENEEDPWASVLDLRTSKRLKDIPAPGGLAGLGVTPDGRTIVLVSDARPELLVVDTADDSVVGSVRLSGHRQPAQIARYSPDGEYLVVTSVEENIVTVLDGTLQHQATVAVGEQPMDMAFTADGARAVVACQGDGTLSAIDLRKGTVVQRVSAGHGVETLSYY